MIPFIGVASSLGGPNLNSNQAADYVFNNVSILNTDFFQKSLIHRLDSSIENDYMRLNHLFTSVASHTYNLASHNTFFTILTGDHSSAVGTWSGVSAAIRPNNLGLIWIDAHLDAHTPETSETGNIHGMPLAALLGYGHKKLTTILSDNPKIDPQNVIIIGARSYEKGEHDLLKKLGVKIYYIDDVNKRGIGDILKEAIDIFEIRDMSYGVSFDLDVLDSSVIQCVGTPVAGGIDINETLSSLSLFNSYPPLAFEIVEYDPSLDLNSEGIRFIEWMLSKIATMSQEAVK